MTHNVPSKDFLIIRFPDLLTTDADAKIDGVHCLPHCHAPRRRGIQYAAASLGPTDVSGILDHPPSRVMTAEGRGTSP